MLRRRPPRLDGQLPRAPLDIPLLDGDDSLNMQGIDEPAVVDAGPGTDTITGTTAADDIDGGSGNDTLNGYVGEDRIRGGDGDDQISVAGGAGNGDHVEGGAGNDRMTGAGSSADISGGAGQDEYGLGATEPADITLDDAANDSYGTVGGMNVRSDVEDVVTTGGQDRLVGSSAANHLDAGGADDDIVGGAGRTP